MHKSHNALLHQLASSMKKVNVGGIYYHWKNPDHHYIVLSVGFCEWDETVCVIYQDKEGDNPLTWVRRLEGEDGWLTKVEFNGQLRNRFTLVE